MDQTALLLEQIQKSNEMNKALHDAIIQQMELLKEISQTLKTISSKLVLDNTGWGGIVTSSTEVKYSPCIRPLCGLMSLE